MNDPGRASRFEPRWPVALAILAVIGLLTLLPGRVRLFPGYTPYLLAIVALVPIVAIELTKASPRWRRIERIVTMLFVVLISFGNLANLANLIVKIQEGATEITGLQLFASSIAVWVTNILAFSMLYWHLDRNGPEARMSGTGTLPDWLFPQEVATAGEAPPGWRPTFVDYLFLSYSTATAFSATDVPPMTSRAKVLMMVDSSISLLTLVVVAARAINIMA
jgi:uncharacterized membrane protein